MAVVVRDHFAQPSHGCRDLGTGPGVMFPCAQRGGGRSWREWPHGSRRAASLRSSRWGL